MLQKQPVSINFIQGIDTKTDPFQIPVGKFFSLVNSVFTSAGRLTKRPGFELLTTLPNTNQTTLTTLNDNLIATGSSLYAFSEDTNQWLNQGNVQPIQLSVQPLVRVSTSQSSPDAAVASTGLTCLVYVDNSVAYYQISDSITGQQIVPRTALPATATNPRVFLLGQFYVITFMATVSATTHLQYVAIPTSTPTAPRAAADITGATPNSLTAAYDGFVMNNNLYLGWNGSGNTVQMNYLSSLLVVDTQFTAAAEHAALMSVTGDATMQQVWFTYWDSTDNPAVIESLLFDSHLNQLSTSANRVTTIGQTIEELTTIATAGTLSVYYEVLNTYTYAPNEKTDFVNYYTMTAGFGVVGPVTILRSVGLASKPFFAPSGMQYVLVTYSDANQPTYFLMDNTGALYMRLAYSNGGGYTASQVLPSISTLNDAFYVPYLVTDFLASTNKGTNLPSGTPTSAIYTQKGVNLATFTFKAVQYSSQIAGALHLTGGQLWEYDGVRPVEFGFQVWPGDVGVSPSPIAGGLVAGVTYFWQFTYEWTDNQGNLHRSAPAIPVSLTVETPPASFTGTLNNSETITAVSSFSGLQVGQHVSATFIPVGAYITSLDPGASSLTISAPATNSGAETITVAGPVSSVDLNVPTLRMTYKLAPNPVRIVGYRWSTTQQVYYQFTSLTSPVINNVTVDSVTIHDGNSDADILGDVILYTTGGVIEDIAPPASVAICLYQNRLFIVDAEDPNLLWFSKQVIESVPVEMSDLLTIYVAPTTGAQGSTGPMTALSAMDDKLIIFKKDAIYYINGAGPDNTGANSTFSDPIFITAAVGSANPNSIVLMPNGIMFQSDKGIWLLGRDLSTSYIGAPVEAYNSQTVVGAETIPATNQVRFVLDNNVTLMYDYYFNQWGTHTNILAVSSTLYQGVMTYLNLAGQVLQETQGIYVDNSTPVLMSLVTSWINLAGLQGFERFYFMFLLGTYFTPFKLNVQLAYDYNASPTQSIVVTPDNFSPSWGGEAQWGSGGAWGGGPGNVFSARMFPEKQKCEAFQVTINEVYDASLGVSAGQGLSLSGLNLVVGAKKGYRTQKAARSFG